MRTQSILCIGLFTLLAGAAGCASSQPQQPPLAESFGVSVRTALESQKLDPNPKAPAPVLTLDGEYAKMVMDQYRKGQQPAAAKDGQIGLGMAKTGQPGQDKAVKP